MLTPTFTSIVFSFTSNMTSCTYGSNFKPLSNSVAVQSRFLQLLIHLVNYKLVTTYVIFRTCIILYQHTKYNEEIFPLQV